MGSTGGVVGADVSLATSTTDGLLSAQTLLSYLALKQMLIMYIQLHIVLTLL